MQHNCKHKNTKFIGILHHTQYPEKCFICKTCGQIITDFITSDEMIAFNKNEILSIQL